MSISSGHHFFFDISLLRTPSLRIRVADVNPSHHPRPVKWRSEVRWDPLTPRPGNERSEVARDPVEYNTVLDPGSSLGREWSWTPGQAWGVSRRSPFALLSRSVILNPRCGCSNPADMLLLY